MKSLQKMIAGLTLGMALCAGLLVASPAAALTVTCINTNGVPCGTFTCPDTIVAGGVTLRLVAVTCTCTSATTNTFGCAYHN